MGKKSEILFLFLLVIAVFLTGSLVTFSPDQILSFRGNLFGSVGIKTAHLLLQTFGYGTAALIFFLTIWMTLIWKEKKLWIIQRTISGLFFVLSFSTLFQCFLKSGLYEPGGVVGEVIYQNLLPLIKVPGILLFSIFSLILSLYSFSNFSLNKAINTISKTMTFLSRKVEIGVKIRQVDKKTAGRKNRREIMEKKPSLFQMQVPKEIPIEFLKAPTEEFFASEEEMKNNKITIESKLLEFGIKGKVVKVNPGPVITVYEFLPEPGIRVSFVVNLFDDLALALGVEAVRIARIPGKTTIGIEVPNRRRSTIYLREILESEEFKSSISPLTLAIGKNVDGSPFVIDLRPFPHLLIGGATGMGKSVAMNTMILSIMFKSSPEEVKFILIDPKRVEFSPYDGTNYLLTPVIKDGEQAVKTLSWAVKEMDRRLILLSNLRVRNLEQYRSTAEKMRREGKEVEQLPYIMIFIDELANLMLTASKEIEYYLKRLAQEARAPGIHLIFATQRPSIDVITGTIKNNFPARIALGVPSRHDSRTIIGIDGAENLLNQGDMLFMSPSSSILRRIHGAYVSEEEVEKIVEFLKMSGPPRYRDIFSELKKKKGVTVGVSSHEKMYLMALKLVLSSENTSATFLQRKLKIGFPRAASFLDRMEEEGVLSPMDENKRRTILVDPTEMLKSLEEVE